MGRLTPQDYEDLLSSGLTGEQIGQLDHFSAEENWTKTNIGCRHKGLVFRYLNPLTGKPYTTGEGKPFYRIKPRDWDKKWHDPLDPPPKYLSPSGAGNKPYFSPLLKNFSTLSKRPVPVDLVEGEKKADCLSANGIFTIGLPGVWGWLDKTPRAGEIQLPPAQTIEDDEDRDKPKTLEFSRLLPELMGEGDSLFRWQGRRVNIVFDSDIIAKNQVKEAAKDLAIALTNLGAIPYLVRLPSEIDARKNGPDDFVVRHGIGAYTLLRENAELALKNNQLNISKEPSTFMKILMIWCVLKDSWRYRPGMGWYKWMDTHWVYSSPEEFEQALVEFQDSQGWKNVTGMDNIVRQLRSRLLVAEDKWNPPNLLVFSNGTLDCSTNKFQPSHSQEQFCTTVLNYSYDPNAQCPTWLNFLDEALRGDQGAIALLQAFLKWVLVPKPRDRKAEIEKSLDLIGPKGSGKGTFLDVVTGLVGAGNYTAIGAETFKNPNYLASLIDKRVAIDYDAFGFLADVGLFNKVISNEPIQAKLLYKNPKEVRLGVVILRAYNRVLEVPDGAEGLDRRIIAVSFSHQPKTLDLELSEKLHRELPGIFSWAWAVDMAEVKRRLSSAGSVASVREASITRFETNNPEFTFLNDVFPAGKIGIKAGDLYQSYVSWCKESGLQAKKRRKFSESLKLLGCTKSNKSNGCFYYDVPDMTGFDVIQYLGLEKAISENSGTLGTIEGQSQKHSNPDPEGNRDIRDNLGQKVFSNGDQADQIKVGDLVKIRSNPEALWSVLRQNDFFHKCEIQMVGSTPNPNTFWIKKDELRLATEEEIQDPCEEEDEECEEEDEDLDLDHLKAVEAAFSPFVERVINGIFNTPTNIHDHTDDLGDDKGNQDGVVTVERQSVPTANKADRRRTIGVGDQVQYKKSAPDGALKVTCANKSLLVLEVRDSEGEDGPEALCEAASWQRGYWIPLKHLKKSF